MMNRGFTLGTYRLEATTPAPHFINPHCFGEDFAKWMQAELKKRLVRASDPIQKDFGWVLHVPHQEHVFTLTIEMVDESIGSVSDEWWIDVSFEKPLNGFRAWFRKPPQAALGGLATIVETILASEPRFQKFASVA